MLCFPKREKNKQTRFRRNPFGFNNGLWITYTIAYERVKNNLYRFRRVTLKMEKVSVTRLSRLVKTSNARAMFFLRKMELLE